MCEVCGYAAAAATQNRERRIVLKDLLSYNNRIACRNREQLDAHGITAVNLMSAPGAGKTSLLEASIPTLRRRYRIAVIEGDLASDSDARRMRALGVPTVQITTGNASHLDADMVHAALHELDLSTIDLLFIENVGNLVCPASFDLGQHLKVALLSVPEGDDKPQKYPVMFRDIDLVLLAKIDLRDHSPQFDHGRMLDNLRAIGCEAPLLRLSSQRGIGLNAWSDWVCAKEAAHSLRISSARAARRSQPNQTSVDV